MGKNRVRRIKTMLEKFGEDDQHMKPAKDMRAAFKPADVSKGSTAEDAKKLFKDIPFLAYFYADIHGGYNIFHDKDNCDAVLDDGKEYAHCKIIATYPTYFTAAYVEDHAEHYVAFINRNYDDLVLVGNILKHRDDVY